MSELRAFIYLDRLQPQLAAFMGTHSPGYLPVAGMAASILELAPGTEISLALDAALKSASIKPGLMTVDRHYGFLEFHAPSQAEVKHAMSVILDSIGREMADRHKPRILSLQVIRKVDPHHAQMINKMRGGGLMLAGLDMLILECRPAGYICLAANEAEKNAGVTLVDVNTVGAEGRLILSGRSSDIERAAQAARSVLERIEGREGEAGKW